MYIPRMVETSLLKDVTDDYYYGCHCTSCLHTARLILSKLRSHLGDDFPLNKIRERLKWQICSSRKVTITFLDPIKKAAICIICLISKRAESTGQAYSPEADRLSWSEWGGGKWSSR